MSSPFVDQSNPQVRYYKPFQMPSEDGDDIWAVSFSNRSGNAVTAAVSIGLSLIALCFWDLVCVIALLFTGNSDPKSPGRHRRIFAHAGIWNAGDPWASFTQLFKFSWDCIPPKENRRRLAPWHNVCYGLTFSLVALVAFFGIWAMSTFIPLFLLVGSVAPAQPTAVFFPALPAPGNSTQSLQYTALRAPAALRALTDARAAGYGADDQLPVTLTFTKLDPTPEGEDMINFVYSYNLTGFTLSLESAAGLLLSVNGSCTTEYGWLVDDPNNQDVYHPWGDASLRAAVSLDNVSIRYPPRPSFRLPARAAQQAENANISFAVFITAAHRASVTPGHDPWYATEERSANAPPTALNATFWIKRKRPALSCWQQDIWSFQGQPVKNVYALKNTPGVKIPRILLRVLESAFTVPKFQDLGNLIGDAILQSQTVSPNGIVDAGRSTLEKSMGMLVNTSYTFSKNIFIETVRSSNDGTYQNIFLDPDGQPLPGSGDFVLDDSNIQTFSIWGIIALLSTMLALQLLRYVVLPVAYYYWKRHVREAQFTERVERREGGEAVFVLEGTKFRKANKFWNRSSIVSADQLLRCVYENGKPADDWSCESSFPLEESSKDLVFALCTKPGCQGHLQVKDRSEIEGPLEYSVLRDEEKGKVGGGEPSLSANGKLE